MSERRGVQELFATEAMAAIFSPDAHVAKLLAFEAALGRAEGDCGVIPLDAAQSIASSCEGGGFDTEALFRAAAATGTVVGPLIRAIGERVGADAARYVHWGATSQDAIDTALVLQMREGLELLERELLALGDACLGHATRHRATVMAGRTLLQQAVPITFGLKAARWLALVSRRVAALRTCRREALALQLGGAAGTLASMGSKGWDVAAAVAARLELPLPDLPWHAERDRMASVAAALGVTAGAVAKIATDVTLLSQTEVGEVSPAGDESAGASSAMPQKRNPVEAVTALAAARLASGAVSVVLWGMAHEHERATGAWQAEWSAIPDAFRHTAGAVSATSQAVGTLEVDPRRMHANLDEAAGGVMAESLATALAEHVGRPEAQAIVKELTGRATRIGISLAAAAREEPRVTRLLTPTALERAFEPAAYLGSTELFIERALDGYRRVRGG